MKISIDDNKVQIGDVGLHFERNYRCKLRATSITQASCEMDWEMYAALYRRLLSYDIYVQQFESMEHVRVAAVNAAAEFSAAWNKAEDAARDKRKREDMIDKVATHFFWICLTIFTLYMVWRAS